ncbi:MAG: hypothetical protein WCF67_03045 [Chitinophagaceae bacterium]
MKKNSYRHSVILFTAILMTAGLFAQVKTVVRLPATTVSTPSFKVVPADAANLLVSAEGTATKNMSYVQFDLSGIPPNANIVSCSLRLTLAAEPSDRTSVVVHQVVNDDMNSPSVHGPQIDSKTILKEDNPRNSVIVLAGMPPAVLQQALSKRKLTLRLSTTFRNGSAAFYSSRLTDLPVQQQDPAFIPRLVIDYTPEPAPSPWSAYRADAQHTAMSPAIFAGAKPAQYAVKEITQFNNNIQKNMLHYKDKIYMVAQDGASSYHLYSVDPVTKLVTPAVSNVRVPSVMGAIDQFGRYYHITDSIIVINLEAGNTIGPRIALPGNSLVKAAPTVGKDGTLYLATRSYIYAYSPYPRFDLLWQYATPSESMSSVALSPDGTIAYVVFGDPLKVIAINTVSAEGKEIMLNKMAGAGKGGGMIPVVNNQGRLFVTDEFPTGNTLYVIDKLTLDTTIAGSKISQPVVAGDGTVYYSDKGTLMSYGTDKTVREFVKEVGEVSYMAADAGNNIYCWNTDNRFFGFARDGTRFLTMDKPLAGSSREWDITLAADGSLYTGTSTRLYGIRPSSFSPSAYDFTIQDLMYNNRTFRADVLTVPEGISFQQGYSTTLTGAQSVNLSPVLKPGSSIKVVSGGTISFRPGFKVEAGAELSCKTGY